MRKISFSDMKSGNENSFIMHVETSVTVKKTMKNSKGQYFKQKIIQ